MTIPNFNTLQNKERRYQTKETNKTMTKRSATINMPPGIFGKYDEVFKEKIGRTVGGPEDLSSSEPTMTQHKGNCSAGFKCVCMDMPLTNRHRCFVCGFAVHVECAMELAMTPKCHTNNAHCDLFCFGCAFALKFAVTKEEVPLNKKPLQQFIRPKYPPLKLVDTALGRMAITRQPQEDTPMEEEKGEQYKMITVPLDLTEEIMDDESSATTRTKMNKMPAGAEKVDQAEEESFKVYINLRLKIDGNPSPKDTATTFKLLFERCKTWLTGIQQMEPTFKLHTADPTAKTQRVVHDIKDFPEKLDELKSFFKGARPSAEGGYQYLKVLGSAKGTTKAFINSVDWMHRDRKENINICQVQAYETQIIGWLLYSHRQIQEKVLKEEICKLEPHLQQFDLRFMRITDGKPLGDRDSRQEPKALHVEVSTKEADLAKQVFSKVYGTKVTEWPRGIRLRWVPAYTTYANTTSVQRYHNLRNRQAGWNKQLQSKTVHQIVNIDAKNLNKGSESMHQALMRIIPTTGNVNTSLFFSVEEAWKGGGYVFTYHPDKREEASATIRGLYARMRATYDSDELMNVFTPNAVEEGQRMKWDPINLIAISEEDNMIEELLDLDEDMQFVENTPYWSRDVVVYQKDKFGTDEATAASFGSKRSTASHPTHPAKRSRTDNSIAGSTSTASSLTANTKATFETRISKMEASNKKIETLLIDLIQRLPGNNNPNTPPHTNQPMEISTTTQGSTISPLGRSIAESPRGDMATK